MKKEKIKQYTDYCYTGCNISKKQWDEAMEYCRNRDGTEEYNTPSDPYVESIRNAKIRKGIIKGEETNYFGINKVSAAREEEYGES